MVLSGYSASVITKPGRHDIAENGVKLQKSIIKQSSTRLLKVPLMHILLIYKFQSCAYKLKAASTRLKWLAEYQVMGIKIYSLHTFCFLTSNLLYILTKIKSEKSTFVFKSPENKKDADKN